MHVPADKNVFVVYHIDSEIPLAVIKNAENPDDPAYRALSHALNPSGDHTQHACLHIDPVEYNKMDHHALYNVHLKKHIPLHKASLIKKG